MIKYFCDKCGKELPLFNNEFTSDMFKVTIEPPEIRRWADDAETGNYMLCYACVRKFNKWLYESDNKYIAMEQEPIPDACKSCSNHPSNGGSGICNCTLGAPPVKC